jgi:hydrogenase nickel incorporation protein HypA/HybF
MHELTITESVVAAVAERVGAARVSRVRLTIGRMSGVVAESVRFCFDVCAAGTVLEGAALEIVEPAARGRCRDCGVESDLADGIPLCGCGSADVEILRGAELHIDEVEVI